MQANRTETLNDFVSAKAVNADWHNPLDTH
jgi:hypothetical protein